VIYESKEEEISQVQAQNLQMMMIFLVDDHVNKTFFLPQIKFVSYLFLFKIYYQFTARFSLWSCLDERA